MPEKFRHLGSLEFSKLLIEKADVAVAPGIGFGEHGDDYVRLALVENEQRIRQAARGVKRFFETADDAAQRGAAEEAGVTRTSDQLEVVEPQSEDLRRKRRGHRIRGAEVGGLLVAFRRRLTKDASRQLNGVDHPKLSDAETRIKLCLAADVVAQGRIRRLPPPAKCWGR